jgi:PAS domain-containing protein
MPHRDEDIASTVPARDDAEMLDLAPVSLWLEDYSGLKALFEQWRRAGVTSLHDYLRGDRDRIKTCSERIRVVKVNRKTLSLFDAVDTPQLLENIGLILRDETYESFVGELVQLWHGRNEFSSRTVNYTLSGRRLDIELQGRVLPGYERSWERVLIAVEDVTERETARRHLAASEKYARGLFEHSPVSLWVEDFSTIKRLLDEVRDRGIVDFRVFTDVHPEFVTRCMSEIRVIDVNRHTLELFVAPDKPGLLNRLDEVFRDDMEQHFREQLIDLWHGKLFQQREVANYALDGSELHLHLQFSVLPGHERDWSLVQVALTDITARKKAEAYLEYLGRHDVLTKLYNPVFLCRGAQPPRTQGPASRHHHHRRSQRPQGRERPLGPRQRRCPAAPRRRSVERDHRQAHCAARIGGDEFAILMPATELRDGEAIMDSIHKLVAINNQFYPGLTLSLSMGIATTRPGERLEAVAKRADLLMFEQKRAYHAEELSGRLRRTGTAG